MSKLTADTAALVDELRTRTAKAKAGNVEKEAAVLAGIVEFFVTECAARADKGENVYVEVYDDFIRATAITEALVNRGLPATLKSESFDIHTLRIEW